VRVRYTSDGIALRFPPLRGWRAAGRLAGVGLALALPALYAAFAYAPRHHADAGGLLALALTASVVYPVLFFGIVFLLGGIYAAGSSLAVTVNPVTIRSERRVLGWKYGGRAIPTASMASLQTRPVPVARGLGGGTSYKIAVIDRAGAECLTVADRIPEERLADELKRLIERYAARAGSTQ
jgi:hypothetical protein